ncbi:hypothetical protein WDV85_16710 [Pseudokineococcus sp. 5B2Z-1]|uniref:hypothetical protein n=1 Tax=Pseudokineococcus sp. 5B2Z-1 TaxID=3132744 RepID=UPI003095E4B7
MADAVTEAVGQTVAALGTLWVNIGTPVLSTNPGTGAPSDAVGFLQTNLYTLTLSLAVLAILVGAARTAWERRGEPLIGLMTALVTFVVVSGAGLAVIALLVTASDALAQALIDRSVTGSFGDNMTALLLGATGATLVGPGLTSLVVIVLGGAALLMSIVQIVLMVARGGMLVILAGIFPTAAAFTNTAMGRQWFNKCLAWLIAFILYKPAAAIVYAAAFRLTGSDVFSDDGTGLIDLITGLTLMLLALVALPALMRFVTPMVGAMASGGGGTAALAAAALPTGAIMAGRALANRAASNGGGGGGKESSSAGGRGGTGPSGLSGSDGPSGAGPSGGGSTSSKGAKGAKSTGGEQAPSPTAAGATTPAGAGAPATASAGAGGAGAGAAGGAGGAGAAGGAAAAAAGPVGIGVAAAAKGVEIADKGRKAAAQAGRDAADSATGEGGGPSGSR